MEILKPNVLIEPTILNWYAWSFLVSPHTHALCLLHQLKLMESFVSAPQIHEQAVQSPHLKGGPFIDLKANQVPQVIELIEDTQRKACNLIEFAHDIQNFERLLVSDAKGGSLEPLYEKLPQSMQGICELNYDINHSPTIHFIERLLYKRFYDDTFQALKISSLEQGSRPFSATTPKLVTENDLAFNIPFSSTHIDELARSRIQGVNANELAEKFDLNGEDRCKFNNLFMPVEDDYKPRGHEDDKTLVRYFGHASVMVSSKHGTIMVDPVVNMQHEMRGSTLTIFDMPETIDYVLITHNHQDHIMFETLLQLRYKIKNIVVPQSNIGVLHDPSIKLVLNHIGFANVIVLEEMEALETSFATITTLPFFGEHGDLNIRSKAGYHVRMHQDNKSVAFLADSNNLSPSLYKNIFDELGSIDALFIGMECVGAPVSWVYGPLMTNPIERKLDMERRLNGSNCEKAISVIECVKAKSVYVYAMGLEEWMNYILAVDYNDESPAIVESNKLITYCQNLGMTAKRLYMKEVFRL